jgi:recombinational DNA repair protein (RecF pathway)
MPNATSPALDRCSDCGTTEGVHMHNSREVRCGFLWPRTATQYFPGFLCVPCWKLANPKLFPRR